MVPLALPGPTELTEWMVPRVRLDQRAPTETMVTMALMVRTEPRALKDRPARALLSPYRTAVAMSRQALRPSISGTTSPFPQRARWRRLTARLLAPAQRARTVQWEMPVRPGLLERPEQAR